MAKKRSSKKKIIISNSERVGFSISDAVYNRARKTIGMINEQIAAYSNEASLVAALNRMHSKSNPEAKVKSVEVPVVARVEDKLPDELKFESKLEAMSMCNRVQFDENNLQLELRKINRKYGSHKPVRIVADKLNKPVNSTDKKNRMAKYLITTFTVYYK